MKRRILLFPLLFTLLHLTNCLSQKNEIENLVVNENKKGRFNGSLLVINKGKTIIDIQKGFANLQFEVKIDQKTKFPIASTTKLITAIAILKLAEKSKINLNEKISQYIDNLPKNCSDIKVSELLTHNSGLVNEPIKAYLSKYKINDYIKNFVRKEKTKEFNYNNVDYILLSKIIENVTGKSFTKAIEHLIINPLNLKNTGFVNEKDVIPNLAYGYHNYTFGTGKGNEPLYNDRRFVSNYFGAGQMYSNTRDLSKIIIALKNKTLISDKYLEYMKKPQNKYWSKWILGYSTFGFYFDNKTFSLPVLRRKGNIDGFNSEIIVDTKFEKIVIILCNTDTANLKKLGNDIFKMIE